MPPKKQFETAIAKRKHPRDDVEHLVFSITRNARHESHSYGRKKMVHETEIRNTASATRAVPSVSVSVRRAAHQRSPYLVRLKREEPPAPFLEKDLPAAPERESSEEWKKEVARLRREAGPRKASRRVAVNFLEKRIGPRTRLSLARTALRVARWFYEFGLSIPLGILLLLHVLIRLVDFFGAGIARAGKRTAHAAGFAVEHVLLSLIALAKAAVLLPVKLLAISVAACYRLLGIIGVAVGRSARNVGESASVVARTFVRPPRHFFRNISAVVLGAALLLLPVKYLHEEGPKIATLRGRVLGSAAEGFSLLGSLRGEVATRELSAAGQTLAGAEEKFREARSSIDAVGGVLRAIIQLTPQGSNGLHAIRAGEELSLSGVLLSGALAPLLSPEQGTSLVANLRIVTRTLAEALPHLTAARSSLEQVAIALVPEEYRAELTRAQTTLPAVERAVSDFLSLGDTLVTVLGGNGPRRYAVLFQNNNELRPAGGFIGSLAIVDMDQGRVSRMEIPGGGSYDFQGYLTENIISPKPLWLINPRWELQDANWYPDWPTSAEKVAWFIEKAGHSSVDGVIALQASTLKELLALLGPVEFPEEGVTLTAENVISEIQRAVEIDYDPEENAPKQYIAELTPRVLDRVLAADSSEFLKLLTLVQDEIARKNILLYFRDRAVQEDFQERKWSPTVLAAEMDYLSVIHANVGGGKTDGAMEESWNQEITIAADGTAAARLTIVRHHAGEESDIFENVNNVDFMRVYAPAGSELVSASGFNPPKPELFESPAPHYEQDEELSAIEGKVFIDEASGTRINSEFGKTAFGNWTQTMPDETTLATVAYRLPFKVRPFDLLNPDSRGGYSLLIQKQAGAAPVFFSIVLRYPPEWGIAWKKVAGEGTIRETGAGLLMFEGVLAKDTGFGVLFTKGVDSR
ncbi:MAG: DUF4012 domain-containing protein [Parcubacteria group bacterium]|nr:DUF4012 domain-containing protein [Parcubacteria group bacterium]